MTVDMETIVSLCKRRGFIFQSSEIYGGLASTWDYGPLGVELKNNVKRAWWKAVVYDREDMDGLDAAIFMHPRIWEASGHVATFHDPLVECQACHKRFRADHVPGKKCPECGGSLTEPRNFNLMLKTHLGPVEDTASVVYLRPETAQGIFVNLLNVQQAMRRKLPFGIAQIGKAFRNEITPGNFTFRSREFEQMEIEYFVMPGTDEEWHQRWIDERFNWYVQLGLSPGKLRQREQGRDELAHYAKRTVDLEYLFPMGWSELEGIANRTDFDLKQHAQFSGKDLSYFDQVSGQRVIPYVIEPSAGPDRATLAFLIDAYEEQIKPNGEKRVVLHLHRSLAPIKVAVLPLARNKPEIVALAKRIRADLRPVTRAAYDDTAAIGKLYARQDEVGTPFCVTVDHQSLEDHQVTVRERDSMEQIRLPVAELKGYLLKEL